jgi:MFS family permease
MGLVELIVGPIMLYFGYRFFKIALFVLGGLPFGVVAYFCALAMLFGDIAALLIGLLAFVIGGALMVCCWFATIFCLGFIFGVAVLALTSISTTDWLNYPLQSWTQAGLVVFAVFTVVFGCVGGYVAIKFQKLLIVIVTSFFGAYFVFVAVFVCFLQLPEFPSVENLFTDTSNDDAGPLLYLGGVVALACTGVYVQYKKTSVGHDHTKATWTGQPHSNDALELQQREGGMPDTLDSA